jgi:hypothetical protein
VTGGASPVGPLSQARVLRGPGEIAEDDATGTLAAVYERVRRALGVSFVPTVFRMLAPYEPYLAAAIGSLSPLLDDPRGSELSARVRAIAAEASAAAGVGLVPAGPDRAAIHALIDRYNEANPRSLVLVRVLARDVAAAAVIMQPPLPQPSPHALLDEILVCHGRLTVPGLWRELYAISPERAAVGWAAVREASQTGAFARALADVIALADEAGAGCTAPTPAALGVAEPGRGEIERILGWFKIVIPTMVVEIECLRRAFAGESPTP